MPSHVIIAINRTSIILIDPDTKEFLSIFEYFVNILSWGHSVTSFVLITGADEATQEKLIFKTPGYFPPNLSSKCTWHNLTQTLLQTCPHADGAYMHELVQNYTNTSKTKRGNEEVGEFDG